MTQRTLAAFLTPEGFSQPPVVAVLREGSALAEAGRYAASAWGARGARRRTPLGARPERSGEPVVLVPGFLAGDSSLGPMSRTLRHLGFRTYRADVRANVGCTLSAADQLEERLEEVSRRRGARVRVVGHSLGGMLARGVAARRPDLVAGIVTMGSPVLAPGAHHVSLARSVEVLVRLHRAGVRGLMAEDCVAGPCARESFDRARAPMPEGVDFTAIFSRRDGIVDWRACLDPTAQAVEVRSSHVGMAFDPVVIAAVSAALRPGVAAASAVEVDRGQTA
ncbi:alpha/beta fold hydrolase [Nocardioides sp. zg-1228]|uniref:alpha/beta fold hydrolase n=1 Tax=Nocardioides sp. zg-1228 TaxID=2763008 RepID=UPI0016434EC4|nr:alpha/beta fold hydrolase [Nocardioides sp. zg-1228]MBC2932912.1 alpha/beta fold hydrolase [Nocardioides sp. zg-1228]QSF56884.1 alpha/beta fold hydrolase [Nocardioides sp. zg-1228]